MSRSMSVVLSGLLLLGGCGPAHPPPASAPAAKADVIVTFDAKTPGCLVALSTEAQGSAVGCDDVVSFVRDELRVRSGAAYDIVTNAGTDAAVARRLDANMKGAGYRNVTAPQEPP